MAIVLLKRLYEKDAAKGNPKAQVRLGMVYLRSKSSDEQKAGLKLIQQAVASGDPIALTEVANLYKDGYGSLLKKNHRLMKKFYTQAADQNCAEAFYQLGECYFYGLGTPESYSDALQSYLKAADQHHTEAEFSLGYLYYNGYGTEQDFNEAKKWFLAAAAKGHRYAQLFCGMLYDRGEGTDKNFEKALKYFEKAAEGNIEEAYYYLGKYNFLGRSLPQNFSQALRLFKKSSKVNPNSELGLCYLKVRNLLLKASRQLVQDSETGEIQTLSAKALISFKEALFHALIFQEKLESVDNDLNFFMVKEIASFAQKVSLFANKSEGSEKVIEPEYETFLIFTLFSALFAGKAFTPAVLKPFIRSIASNRIFDILLAFLVSKACMASPKHENLAEEYANRVQTIFTSAYKDRGFGLGKPIRPKNKLQIKSDETAHKILTESRFIVKEIAYKRELKQAIIEQRDNIIRSQAHNIKNILRSVEDSIECLRDNNDDPAINDALFGTSIISSMVNSISLSFSGAETDFFYDAKNTQNGLGMKDIFFLALKSSVSNIVNGGLFYLPFYENYFPDLPNKEVEKIQIDFKSSCNEIESLCRFCRNHLFQIDYDIAAIEKLVIGITKGSHIKILSLLNEILFNAVKYTSTISANQRRISIKFFAENHRIHFSVENTFKPTFLKTSGNGNLIVDNLLVIMGGRRKLVAEDTVYSITVDLPDFWES